MANTVIQLRNSTVTGNVPSSLANGEISINNRDGKFFYSTPAGVVVTHYPYLGPAGLNQEVQFNDAGTLGSTSKLTIDKTSGLLSATLLKSTQSSGDEGGQIDLALATTNQSLSGTVAIDVFQNKLRIFETSGSNRGVYIDLANGASSSVGTNLLSSSTSTDTWARGQANAAFLAANTPSYTANSAASYANGAFAAANSATATDITQNNNITIAFTQANAAFLQANSAFTVANNALTTTNGSIAWSTANSAASYANAAFAQANTDYTTISTTAGTYGNAAYVPVFTVAANGRITAVTNTAITGSGATIGDVLALSIALG